MFEFNSMLVLLYSVILLLSLIVLCSVGVIDVVAAIKKCLYVEVELGS